LLLAKVPKEKLAFKKKVLAIKQTDDGVTIHCSDKTSYEGHILVGADGAYSAVRQCLYKDLAQKNKLPASDATQMNGKKTRVSNILKKAQFITHGLLFLLFLTCF